MPSDLQLAPAQACAFATARRGVELPGKYPTAIPVGERIVPLIVESVRVNANVDEGAVISKSTAFETPPPGDGFDTVTGIVPATSKSVAGTITVIRLLLTAGVGRTAPFQFMVAPGANPVPFTVSINPELPGAAAAGKRGLFTNGTGLVCAKRGGQTVKQKGNDKIANTNDLRIHTPRIIISSGHNIPCKLTQEKAMR